MSSSSSSSSAQSPVKKRSKKSSMQQRKKSKSSAKSKSKSRSKHKGSSLQSSLCYAAAVILFLVLSFTFYYSQYSKPTKSTIRILEPHEEFIDLTHLNEKFPSVETKYDHSMSSNALLLQSQSDKEAPIPMLFKLTPSHIKRQWNHDAKDFTQGFEIFHIDASNNKLIAIESTGLYKQSKLKYIELAASGELAKSGKKLPTVAHQTHLKDEYFGEGCTLYIDGETGNRFIYQLTWKIRKVIVYDLELNVIREMAMPPEMKEGWGLYYDVARDEFLATDGSSTVFVIEPKQFKVVSKLKVKYLNNDREGAESKVIALANLNEIEVVNGWIVANVWYNTNLYVISPHNGFVYAIIECWKIFPDSVRRVHHAVLNGVAFDSSKNELIITGKNWPKIFAIDLPPFMLQK